jgi:hypothetical protein
MFEVLYKNNDCSSLKSSVERDDFIKSVDIVKSATDVKGVKN